MIPDRGSHDVSITCDGDCEYCPAYPCSFFNEIHKRNKHMMCPLCGYDLDGQDYSCTNIYHCHYGRM